MSRAGRKRRKGARHPKGRLVRERGESAREVAGRMPHRRALGEAALDYRAESELGRLLLANVITPDHFVAGTAFRRAWGAYIATIYPPKSLRKASAAFFECGGCLDAQERNKCHCARRRGFYEDAERWLRGAGFAAMAAVKTVVLYDQVCPSLWYNALQLGLGRLASHFGLLTSASKALHKYTSTESRPPSAGVHVS